MVDLKAGKGTAQRVGKSVFAALGTPLAEPKSQRMGTPTDFLGVTHDLSVVLTKRCIPHTPKQAMQDKLRPLIKERTDANECTHRAGEQAERGMLVDVGSAVPTPG